MVTSLTDDQLADLKRAIYGPLADEHPTPSWTTVLNRITEACDQYRSERFNEQALLERVAQTLIFATPDSVPSAVDMLCRHLTVARQEADALHAAIGEAITGISYVRVEASLPAHLDDRLNNVAIALRRAQMAAGHTRKGDDV